MDEGSEKSQQSKHKNIWSDLLLEQSLTDKTGQINVERKPGTEVSRGAETYDTSLKKFRESAETFQKRKLDVELESYRKIGKSEAGKSPADPFEPIYDPEFNLGDVEASKFLVSDEKISTQIGEKRKRPQKNKKPANSNKKEIPEKYKKHPVLIPTDPPERVGLHIARALEEPKTQLIINVTKVIGNEKAIELFNKTREIEAHGGMMTLHQERRKTPGGVFITLLKDDPNLNQESIGKIFEFDNLFLRPKLKAAQRRRKRAKNDQKTNYEDHLAAAKEKLLKEKELRELKDRKEIFFEEMGAAGSKNDQEEGELSESSREISPNSDDQNDEIMGAVAE